MATAHRKPTIIALRAAREAVQIAREVAYPHLSVPRPVEPYEPPDPSCCTSRAELCMHARIPHRPLVVVLAVAFALGSILLAILALKYG